MRYLQGWMNGVSRKLEKRLNGSSPRNEHKFRKTRQINHKHICSLTTEFLIYKIITDRLINLIVNHLHGLQGDLIHLRIYFNLLIIRKIIRKKIDLTGVRVNK